MPAGHQGGVLTRLAGWEWAGKGAKGGRGRREEGGGGAWEACGSEGKGEGGGERRREREKGLQSSFCPYPDLDQIEGELNPPLRLCKKAF